MAMRIAGPDDAPEPAGEVIRVRDQFYILATSDRLDDRTRVLKEGESFAVFDRRGDICNVGRGEQGLYVRGTRYLSHLELSLVEGRLLLLGSTVHQDAPVLSVDLTNPDLLHAGRAVERGQFHVVRINTLQDGVLEQDIEITNFGASHVEATLCITTGADFADIFEVRGFARARRGRSFERAAEGGDVVLGYEGLDRVVRRTRIGCDPAARVAGADLLIDLALAPRATQRLRITVRCSESPDAGAYVATSDPQPLLAAGATRAMPAAKLETGSLRWNDWLQRSASDVEMMATDTEFGRYPYAGIPWFSAPFGRDGIITALERLWLDPALARGVLRFLAATQAVASSPESDAEPGKILHEARLGELASLGEVPFGRYYGSVDATPLFVALAGAYFERTGDRAFVAALWPHVEAALGCIDDASDERGFLVYQRRSPQGLVQQGWKDSSDSVFHADGRLASGPIALCEVQGYVHLAKRAGATLAAALGDAGRAESLARQADVLAERFERAFWCEELGTYALALDGDGAPCRVRSSNPGHCLYAGIAAPERAARVVAGLLEPALYSGWGVRTLASTERRYNPMSYHNGSVWPHDNALIALGFARYGFQAEALQLFTGWFEASLFIEFHRMPELICGFPRRDHQGPTAYPLACTPQAWSAAAAFGMLQAVLGLSVSATRREIRFDRPRLPPNLRELRIADLRVGDARVDIEVSRRGAGVVVNPTRREGDVRVLIAS